MRLKPKRFIAHKIGPFEHLELNWETDSRYTLIVAENGMGKTTLVTALSICLSFATPGWTSPRFFRRYFHSNESYIYLELVFDGQPAWILYILDQLILDHLVEKVIDPPTRDHKYLSNQNIVYSDLAEYIWHSWREKTKMQVIAASYGVSRDLTLTDIHGYKELENGDSIFQDILDPFSPIQSNEILQWVANQYFNHALALAENKQNEAESYLQIISRLENFLSTGLGYPIAFQLQRNPLRLGVKQNGNLLAIDQLSDGTRSFLSWALDFLVRASRMNWENPLDSALAPGLILVDEIDSHLHPEWQRRILPAVSQLLPETYIIATTHSPFVVNSADDAQLFQIYRGEDGQLQVKSSYDDLYGQPADLVLQKAFVPSLYPPEIETKLKQLSQLAQKVMAKTATPQEKKAHQTLLRELAQINPWLENLLNLTQGVHLPS